MSIAYALIIGRLWGSKPPGEKMDIALSNQARAKKKVMIYENSIPHLILRIGETPVFARETTFRSISKSYRV